MCKGNNTDCNHLFLGNGAVNTIVRLPNNCGSNPFARVAQHQVLQSNLVTHGNGSQIPVHELTLDTDFAAAGPSHEVYFSVQGQSGQDNSNAVNRRSHRRLRFLARSQNHVYRQVDGNSTTGGNTTVDGVDNVHGGLSGRSFDKTVSASPSPVNFSGQQNLFTSNDGSGSIDINANLQASINISAAAAGTFIPPAFTQFGVTLCLDGNADATLNVIGDLSWQVSSGDITLFNTVLAGISIHSILEIGPQFTLLGQIDANFGLQNVNAAVEVNYDLGGASFAFPPQAGSNTDGITSTSKQLTFSADPDVGATLGATAHLIPQVSLGIKALDGIASASVFLNFDGSLGLQGNISSGTNPQPCLSGNAEINVEVGAKGKFFGLFDASTGQSLFDESFPLFQECFAGNLNSSNPATQSSVPASTSTVSASQSSATDSTTANSTSQTSTTDATSTDSAPQTSAAPTTTDFASQTSAADASATDSASETGATGATATPNSRHR